jgi:hypothetical protein
LSDFALGERTRPSLELTLPRLLVELEMLACRAVVERLPPRSRNSASFKGQSEQDGQKSQRISYACFVSGAYLRKLG